MESILSSSVVQIATLCAVALMFILMPTFQWLVARRLPVSVAGTYRKLATNTYARVVLLLVPVFLAALLGYQKDALAQSVANWFIGLLLFGGLSVCWAAHTMRDDLMLAKSKSESKQRAARLSRVSVLVTATMVMGSISVLLGILGALYLLLSTQSPLWFWAIPFLLSLLTIVSHVLSVGVAAVARAYASDAALGA